MPMPAPMSGGGAAGLLRAVPPEAFCLRPLAWLVALAFDLPVEFRSIVAVFTGFAATGCRQMRRAQEQVAEHIDIRLQHVLALLGALEIFAERLA